MPTAAAPAPPTRQLFVAASAAALPRQAVANYLTKSIKRNKQVQQLTVCLFPLCI